MAHIEIEITPIQQLTAAKFVLDNQEKLREIIQQSGLFSDLGDVYPKAAQSLQALPSIPLHHSPRPSPPYQSQDSLQQTSQVVEHGTTISSVSPPTTLPNSEDSTPSLQTLPSRICPQQISTEETNNHTGNQSRANSERELIATRKLNIDSPSFTTKEPNKHPKNNKAVPPNKHKNKQLTKNLTNIGTESIALLNDTKSANSTDTIKLAPTTSTASRKLSATSAPFYAGGTMDITRRVGYHPFDRIPLYVPSSPFVPPLPPITPFGFVPPYMQFYPPLYHVPVSSPTPTISSPPTQPYKEYYPANVFVSPDASTVPSANHTLVSSVGNVLRAPNSDLEACDYSQVFLTAQSPHVDCIEKLVYINKGQGSLISVSKGQMAKWDVDVQGSGLQFRHSVSEQNLVLYDLDYAENIDLLISSTNKIFGVHLQSYKAEFHTKHILVTEKANHKVLSLQDKYQAGNLIAYANAEQILIQDAGHTTTPPSITLHISSSVTSIAKGSAMLVSGHANGKVVLWDLRNSGRELTNLSAHSQSISGSHLLNTNLLVSTSRDSYVVHWDLRNTTHPVIKVKLDPDASAPIVASKVSPSGKIAFATTEGLYLMERNGVMHPIVRLPAMYYDVAWSSSEALFASTFDGNIAMFSGCSMLAAENRN